MTRTSKIQAGASDEPVRDRAAVLDRAINEILKQYGDGAVMRLGEATHLAVETIPTGSLALDLALGVGGGPRGGGGGGGGRGGTGGGRQPQGGRGRGTGRGGGGACHGGG